MRRQIDGRRGCLGRERIARSLQREHDIPNVSIAFEGQLQVRPGLCTEPPNVGQRPLRGRSVVDLKDLISLFHATFVGDALRIDRVDSRLPLNPFERKPGKVPMLGSLNMATGTEVGLMVWKIQFGVESFEKIGQKIGERPLLSAAIALGIGFVLAKLLTTRR